MNAKPFGPRFWRLLINFDFGGFDGDSVELLSVEVGDGIKLCLHGVEISVVAVPGSDVVDALADSVRIGGADGCAAEVVGYEVGGVGGHLWLQPLSPEARRVAMRYP